MSTDRLPPDFCPYKGLEPYTAKDRDFFFGRERDQKTIIANLYATPLTILYGASGVGKTSILLASVVPHLRETLRIPIVIFRNWQGDFMRALKDEVLKEISGKVKREVVEEIRGREEKRSRDNKPALLDAFLAECVDVVDSPIFFIFDQFEEYFLYHQPSTQDDSFDAQFARAVNRREVDAKFLLSMREEGLSKLDRFRGRIPNMLNHTLRLNHLDRGAAVRAICEPLRVYNSRVPAREQVTAEARLMAAIIRRARQRSAPGGGQGHIAPISRRSFPIETPILQMLTTRVWEEEARLWGEAGADPAQAGGARTLRYQTLKERLKGAENVLNTYLDKIMEESLDERQREVASRVFQFLVTPDGSKIAQAPATLAEWTGLDLEDVRELLKELSAPRQGNMRIMRNVPAPGQKERYEITHDVLGLPMLNWRRGFVRKHTEERIRLEEAARAARRRQQERARWMRFGLAALSVLLLMMMVTLIYALRARASAVEQRNIAEEQRRIAEEQKRRTEEQRSRAEQALDAAEEEKGKAEVAMLEAKMQADLAMKREAEARKAQQRAADARKLAEGAREREAAARRASEQARLLAEARGQTDRLYQRGLGYYLNGEYQRAIGTLEETRSQYRRIEDSTGEVSVLNNIGAVYNSAGQKEEALKSYRLALDLIGDRDTPASARTLVSIGELYTELGQSDVSERYLRQALRTYREVGDTSGEAKTLNSLSTLYLKRGNLAGASEYLRSALGIYQNMRDERGVAETFINLGTLSSQLGRKQEALSYYQRALESYGKVDNPLGEAQALNRIGELYDSLGEKDKAKESYQRANELLLGRRR